MEFALAALEPEDQDDDDDHDKDTRFSSDQPQSSPILHRSQSLRRISQTQTQNLIFSNEVVHQQSKIFQSSADLVSCDPIILSMESFSSLGLSGFNFHRLICSTVKNLSDPRSFLHKRGVGSPPPPEPPDPPLKPPWLGPDLVLLRLRRYLFRLLIDCLTLCVLVHHWRAHLTEEKHSDGYTTSLFCRGNGIPHVKFSPSPLLEFRQKLTTQLDLYLRPLQSLPSAAPYTWFSHSSILSTSKDQSVGFIPRVSYLAFSHYSLICLDVCGTYLGLGPNLISYALITLLLDAYEINLEFVFDLPRSSPTTLLLDVYFSWLSSIQDSYWMACPRNCCDLGCLLIRSWTTCSLVQNLDHVLLRLDVDCIWLCCSLVSCRNYNLSIDVSSLGPVPPSLAPWFIYCDMRSAIGWEGNYAENPFFVIFKGSTLFSVAVFKVDKLVLVAAPTRIIRPLVVP